ncbi:hypothetical protein CNR22_22065 [Sphingobacteriaceae bacterium]|nr:hypothetical protein CNR22_22065 [Sphingobacteriaceae bacterium]
MKTTYFLKLFAFCILLLILRALQTGNLSFFFLLWNLFLACIPYALIKKYNPFAKAIQRNLILVLTLLFLPNAPYILTDLFHLTKNLIAPMWFDLILILSFSLLGLSLFVMTIARILDILSDQIKSRVQLNLFKFLILLSNGYGIYLGRYLRFNSWDVLSNPDDLVLQMFYSVFDSKNCKETLGVTFTFTIFLYLVYEIYDSFKTREGGKTNGLL